VCFLWDTVVVAELVVAELCISDKLRHFPCGLHLHGPCAISADAGVERVVRRRVHGRPCSREVTRGK